MCEHTPQARAERFLLPLTWPALVGECKSVCVCVCLCVSSKHFTSIASGREVNSASHSFTLFLEEKASACTGKTLPLVTRLILSSPACVTKEFYFYKATFYQVTLSSTHSPSFSSYYLQFPSFFYTQFFLPLSFDCSFPRFFVPWHRW